MHQRRRLQRLARFLLGHLRRCEFTQFLVNQRQQFLGRLGIAEIAEVQAIPLRFLEVILSQLKQGRFVTSQRGNKGGYILVSSPEELTVGEIMRFMQGPLGPVDCVTAGSKDTCPLYGDCAFLPMWEKVGAAVSDVYDNTTFQDLVNQEKQNSRKKALSYSI